MAAWSKPGGLHLYANYPFIRFGPVSLAVAGALRKLDPGHGQRLTILAVSLLGPPLVLFAERAAVALRGTADGRLRAVTLLSGGVFVLAWTETTWTWIHPDEALAVAGAAVAVWAVATGRPFVAGTAAGLAVGAKAWALIVLVLLAYLPLRDAIRAAGVALAVVALTWGPFVIADPSTLHSQEGRLPVVHQSGLYALGVHQHWVPGWVRPVQLGVALALVALAVRRRRLGVALLAAIGFRLAIDPQTWSYYCTALVFAGLVWDLCRRGRPLPIWAPLAYLAFLVVPSVAPSADVEGAVRLATGLAAAAMVAVVTRRQVRGV